MEESTVDDGPEAVATSTDEDEGIEISLHKAHQAQALLGNLARLAKGQTQIEPACQCCIAHRHAEHGGRKRHRQKKCGAVHAHAWSSSLGPHCA